MVIAALTQPILNKLFPASVCPRPAESAAPAEPQEKVTLSQARPRSWMPRPQTWPTPLLGVLAVAVCAAGKAAEVCTRCEVGQIKRPHCDSPFGEKPAVQLERPLVLVPGFHTPFEAFDHLTEKLVEGGANGGHVFYTHNGEVFTDPGCHLKASRDEVASAKVFVVQMFSRQDQPVVGSYQLRRDLKAIRAGTGGEKVDVVGYSMGGLATRTYLNQAGGDIDSFMMVGTPNHGSAMADTTIGLLNLRNEGWDTSWLLARKPITDADRGALTCMRSDLYENENLTALNENWDRQRAQVRQVRIVGSETKWTLSLDGFEAGDGTVTKGSLAMPDVDVRMLPGRHARHGQLFENPALYDEMSDFFGWKPCS